MNYLLEMLEFVVTSRFKTKSDHLRKKTRARLSIKEISVDKDGGSALLTVICASNMSPCFREDNWFTCFHAKDGLQKQKN